MAEKTPVKIPLTDNDVLKQIAGVKKLGYGRIEVIIGEGRIVEINVLHKFREGIEIKS
jgi:hypothetical protein